METAFFDQKEKINFFETKLGKSDPPLTTQSEKVIKISQKSQKLTVLVRPKKIRRVERLSLSNSSRSTDFFNLNLEYISPSLTLQEMNALLNAGDSHTGKKRLNQILDSWDEPIQLTIQTMTDHRGTANFVC